MLTNEEQKIIILYIRLFDNILCVLFFLYKRKKKRMFYFLFCSIYDASFIILRQLKYFIFRFLFITKQNL